MEFEVSLQLHTPCKRRIVVPANLDLYQFHEVFQVCFGWHDSHLHQFVLEVDAFGRPVDIIQPLWDEMEDCGGPDGSAYVMKILNDPDYPEHERLVEWMRQM